FESALVFGRRVLEALGLDPERAQAVEDFVRARDLDRLALQQAEGITAGLEIWRTRLVQPEPLSEPRHEAQSLNPAAEGSPEKSARRKGRRAQDSSAGGEPRRAKADRGEGPARRRWLTLWRVSFSANRRPLRRDTR